MKRALVQNVHVTDWMLQMRPIEVYAIKKYLPPPLKFEVCTKWHVYKNISVLYLDIMIIMHSWSQKMW